MSNFYNFAVLYFMSHTQHLFYAPLDPVRDYSGELVPER